MQKCLQAVASEEFFRPDDVHTVIGVDVGEYMNLSEEFSKLTEFDKSRFDLIERAAAFIVNYPARNRQKLGVFLGVRQIYLRWFGSHLIYDKTHWSNFVEDSGWTLYSAQKDMAVEFRF